MCAECVTPEKATAIELVDSIAGDESDGVFWGVCEEHGVTVEDLEAYYTDHGHKKLTKSAEPFGRLGPKN